MAYGNTETPSMHCRFSSATLSQLFSPGKQPGFRLGESQWDTTVVKKKEKEEVRSKMGCETLLQQAFIRRDGLNFLLQKSQIGK